MRKGSFEVGFFGIWTHLKVRNCNFNFNFACDVGFMVIFSLFEVDIVPQKHDYGGNRGPTLPCQTR